MRSAIVSKKLQDSSNRGVGADNRTTGNIRQKHEKIYGVYIDSVLTKKVVLSIVEIGKNIKENLQRKIAKSMEGKCIEEGFIRPGSVNVMSYSSGHIDREFIHFQTVFSCKVCHPVEGMLIECTTKTITKAGIHAEVVDGETIPLTVFVARDHHTTDKNFQNIKENDKIIAKVIGIRYELNDPYICVIAKLVNREHFEMATTTKQKKPIKILGGDDSDDNDADEDDYSDDL